MIIDQLPLLSGDGVATDEFPIERGTTTYKATLPQILAASDPVPTENSTNAVQSGGTFAALATKQDKITASGILKGNGSGGVSTATAGTDYLTTKTSYSPIKTIGASPYAIVASDIGKTLRVGYALRNTEVTITLDQTVSSSIPVGAEIAFINDFKSTILLATSGVRVNYPGSEYSTDNGYSSNAAHSFRVSERFSMCALKKMENNSANGDLWGIIGNVEVVT